MARAAGVSVATVPWVANNKGQHSRIHKKPSTQGCTTIWISPQRIGEGLGQWAL